MRFRRLGRTGLEVSAIGFGAWALGGQWGAADEAESVAAIRRAIDHGVNWIDTAAAYGRDGNSERVVAKALRGLTDPPYVFTKCGFMWDVESGQLLSNLKGDSIRREVEASLRRLERDAIDLYQIHWREPDQDIEEAWSTLLELKAEGKVLHVGVSNFDVDQLARCEALGPVETLQPPYSMLIRTPLWTTPFVDNTPRESVESDILPFCLERGIGVVVYSPLGSGLLSGRMTRDRLAGLPPDDWRHDDPDFRAPIVDRTLALVERLAALALARGVSIGELAIAWALRAEAVAGAIVGFRRPGQVDELIGAPTVDLSSAEWAEVDRLLAAA